MSLNMQCVNCCSLQISVEVLPPKGTCHCHRFQLHVHFVVGVQIRCCPCYIYPIHIPVSASPPSPFTVWKSCLITRAVGLVDTVWASAVSLENFWGTWNYYWTLQKDRSFLFWVGTSESDLSTSSSQCSEKASQPQKCFARCLQLPCVLVCIGVMLSIFFCCFLIWCLVCCSAATMALTLANLEGEESFDASMLGQADEVVQERVCDDELIVIKR